MLRALPETASAIKYKLFFISEDRPASPISSDGAQLPESRGSGRAPDEKNFARPDCDNRIIAFVTAAGTSQDYENQDL